MILPLIIQLPRIFAFFVYGCCDGYVTRNRQAMTWFVTLFIEAAAALLVIGGMLINAPYSGLEKDQEMKAFSLMMSIILITIIGVSTDIYFFFIMASYVTEH